MTKLKTNLIKIFLIVTLIYSNSCFSKDVQEIDSIAPGDQLINKPLDNDWFLNNKKFQLEINKALLERKECFEEIEGSFDFSLTWIVGGLTVSVGVGIGLGFLLFK